MILLSAVLSVTGCAGTGKNAAKPEEPSGQTAESTEAREGEEKTEDAVSGEKEQLPVTTLAVTETESLPQSDWQASAAFPDRKDKIDDTLAMNSLLSFEGYHGQGKLYFSPSETVSHFRMYVNNREVETSALKGGRIYELDFADAAVNGLNTLQVSGIEPMTAKKAVQVWIPYPEIIPGSPEEEGISEESLSLISDIIETDVESGFTAAQLAVVRNGRLVYENSWGKTNSYLKDGKKNDSSPDVTNETMFVTPLLQSVCGRRNPEIR
ncbi:MAG: hypothetical protein IJU87_08815 [Lachnospiraceae bacterium]|nr:hypothetical protein [Lachnospiraceae bacterium]